MLRLTTEHATDLLAADRASAWLRERGERFTEQASRPRRPEAASGESRPDLASLIGAELASRVRRDRLVRWPSDADSPADDRMGGGPLLALELGESSLAEALILVARDEGATPFTVEEERRAGEIADHAGGALRRAQMSAQAAEVEALRELDQMKSGLMDMLAHDLQNPRPGQHLPNRAAARARARRPRPSTARPQCHSEGAPATGE